RAKHQRRYNSSVSSHRSTKQPEKSFKFCLSVLEWSPSHLLSLLAGVHSFEKTGILYVHRYKIGCLFGCPGSPTDYGYRERANQYDKRAHTQIPSTAAMVGTTGQNFGSSLLHLPPRLSCSL